VEGEPAPLPEEVKTALFRVSQEALANVAKHAKARRVEMTLSFGADGVTLRVVDDGQGFEVDAVQRDPHRGIGLRNMRERLASIGGTFEVHAAPGAGTQLLAKVPAQAPRRLS
jgi:two-component system NarL family sensor kinase